ncbi:MAG TPA: hypothetical protein VLX44_04155 [Xanthobacteraceae bacterium]|nr:hypothetical protein [Xanthobacteraceae bacterium]
MRKTLIATLLATFVFVPSASAVFAPNRTVTALDGGARTFTCEAKPGEARYTYKTTAKTIYRVSGRRVRLTWLWNKGSFSDIKVGEIVTVQFHLSGGERIADRVAIYPKP